MRQEHGPKIITLGNNIISERAAQAIEAQPLRRTVHLAELNLIDDTKIEYKGAQIKISKSGFSDLLKILKIPQAFIKRFGEGDVSLSAPHIPPPDMPGPGVQDEEEALHGVSDKQMSRAMLRACCRQRLPEDCGGGDPVYGGARLQPGSAA